jgi:hypothetical protein
MMVCRTRIGLPSAVIAAAPPGARAGRLKEGVREQR